MSNNKTWFGTLYDGTGMPGSSTTTRNAKMQFVPTPDTGMDASYQGHYDTLLFENGGADVVSSAGSHRVYDMDWNLREAKGAQGLDIIKHYSQRFFGPGLLYWADPMEFQGNMMPPSWASPGLIEEGWPNIYTAAPIFANTAANIRNQPARSATFTVTQTANTAPTSGWKIAVIPVPPGTFPWFGWSGSVTGTGAVFTRAIMPDGSYGTLSPVSPQAVTSTTRLSTALYIPSPPAPQPVAYEIFLGRTSAAASTVTVTSMMFQIFDNLGFTPSVMDHVPGGGATGCKFTTAAVESYTLVDPVRSLKGAAATLVEVGAWKK